MMRIETRAYSWNVHDIGDGPVMLLLHGAGASAQSYRHVIPRLAKTHRVLTPDLPGHAQTRTKGRNRLRLDMMAQDLAALLVAVDVTPDIVVGHSAGAALGARLCLDQPRIRGFVSINGAFEMFDGLATWLFPLMAKALAVNPLTAMVFARTMTAARVAELLRATGSEIDDEGQEIYRTLMQNRRHVDGVLRMMAGWSLTKLNADLPHLETPTLLITGAKDKAVPPRVSDDLAKRLSQARVQTFANYGHLIHEEAPEEIASAIDTFVSGLCPRNA